MAEHVTTSTAYLPDEPGSLSQATQRLLRDALEQVVQPTPTLEEHLVPMFMYARKSGKSATARRVRG